jgi:hypothetical protein
MVGWHKIEVVAACCHGAPHHVQAPMTHRDAARVTHTAGCQGPSLNLQSVVGGHVNIFTCTIVVRESWHVVNISQRMMK